MKLKFVVFLFSLLLVFSNLVQAKNKIIAPDNLYPKVKIETSMGNIIIELDRVKAPLTVNNFLTYVVDEEYNNTIFHRVIDGFILQGGGYDKEFTMKKVNQDIVNESGNGLKNEMGTIAMAKESKPHTANRQFFFNLADNTNLDPGRDWGYAVFGSVTEGYEVIEKMAKVKTHYHDGLNWQDVPVEPLLILKVSLLPDE